MNFDLDEDQLMFRDQVNRFVSDNYDLSKRAAYRADPVGFSTQVWSRLAELGLISLPFSEAAGGMQAGGPEIITVMQELGRGLVAEPYLSDVFLAGRLLDRAGTKAQRDMWLPAIIAGEKRLALAHVETAARYNQTFVRCAANRRSDGVELTGVKTFVLAGEGADGFIVSARDEGAADARAGLSLWLVPSDAPRLERRSYRLVDGSVACELRLHGVQQAEALEGGVDALMATFDEARLAACAEMVGVMSTLFEATLEHLRTRKQFGQPIGSFQALQHRMADQYAALEQSRSHMFRAALVTPEESCAAIAGAKAFISAAALRLGEECIQLHGGMGSSDDLLVGHGHKRLLLLATLLGDSDAELDRYVALTA